MAWYLKKSVWSQITFSVRNGICGLALQEQVRAFLHFEWLIYALTQEPSLVKPPCAAKCGPR